MAKIDLASLVVRLEAQTAQYQKQLDQATRKLGSFQKQTNNILKSIGGFFAVREAIRYTQAIVDQADRMNDLSKATGETVETLSRLSFAAEQNGGDLETLATGLRALSVSAAAAAKGTGEDANAFRALGVSVTDTEGKLRPLGAIFNDVADGFERFRDGAGKAAVAQTLFSRSGTALIPTLNLGSEGLKRLGEESDRLGNTMSTKSARSADEFNDALVRVKGQLAGIVRESLLPLLDGFASINEEVGETSAVMSGAQGIAYVLAGALKVLATAALYVSQTFQSAGGAVAALWAAQVQALKGNFKEAIAVLRERGKDYEKEVQTLKDRVERIWMGAPSAPPAPVVPQADRPEIEMPDLQAIEQLRAMADGLREQIATFDKGEAAALRYRLTIGKMADDVKRAGDEGAKLAQQLIADAEALERLEANKTLNELGKEIAQQAATFDKTDAEILQYRLTMGDLAKVVREAGRAGRELSLSLVEQQEQLDRLKATKEVAEAMVDLNAQISALRGNVDGVDLARFDASVRDLEKTMTQLGDTSGLDRVQELRHLTALQARYNEEVERASLIQERLRDSEERIRNSQETGALTEFQAMQALNDERVKAAGALDEILAKQRAIATEIDNPQLIQQVEAFATAIDSVRAQTDLLAKSIKASFEDSFASAFADFVMGTSSAADAFKSFTRSVLSDLAEMASRNLAQTLMGSLGGGGGGGGGFFGSLAGLFGGKRARGGPVSPGRAYLVNEETPNSEIFVPSIAGRIQPAAAGGGMSVTNHFAISAPAGTISAQTQQQIAAAAARGISQANRRNN